jgi:hypothetical protein
MKIRIRIRIEEQGQRLNLFFRQRFRWWNSTRDAISRVRTSMRMPIEDEDEDEDEDGVWGPRSQNEGVM